MSIWHDGAHYMIVGGPQSIERLQAHTGPRIPSNILAEVDRKVDEGTPQGGDLVFNNYDGFSAAAGTLSATALQSCVFKAPATVTAKDATTTLVGVEAGIWRPAAATPPVYTDCGASTFF